MPDVHVPKLDEHGAKSALKVTIEVIMFSVGVYVEPSLSLGLSQVYNTQATAVALGNGLLQDILPKIDKALK